MANSSAVSQSHGFGLGGVEYIISGGGVSVGGVLVVLGLLGLCLGRVYLLWWSYLKDLV